MTRRTFRDQKTKDAAVLGIDLGSTAVRAALVDFVTQTLQPIQNLEVAQDSLFSKGDFPAACCPFSKNPLETVGEKALELPRNVSAKYLMYLLANADDSVLSKYPLSQELRERRGDPDFLATCRAILVQLLKDIRKRIDQICEKKLLAYTEIVLTIPIQWEKPFQTVYVSVVAEAFGWEDKLDSISVALEADALAHYVINEEQRELEDWQYVLFLDFGGHSMSFSQFKLDQLGENTTFIEMSSGGCAGGSEMWSHHVSEVIKKKLEKLGINDVDERRRWSLTKQFSNKKSTIMGDVRAKKFRSLPLYYGEPDGIATVVVLSPQEVRECFDQGMSGPINLAREKLKELSKLDEASIGVVVSGGSLKTSEAREDVFQDGFVDMKRVKFTSEMDFHYLSLVNCHGAALARTNKTTVQDFFKDGAALGIQVLHNALTNDMWSNDVLLLLDSTGGYRHQVFTKKNNDMQLKVICDPHYGHRARPDAAAAAPAPAPGINGQSARTLDINHCYDLFHLALSRRWSARCRSVAKNCHLPLYFDPAHNSLHVDVDMMGPGVYDEQQQLIRGGEEPASAPSGAGSGDNENPQPKAEGQSSAKPYDLRPKTERKKPHRLKSLEPPSPRRKSRRLAGEPTYGARKTKGAVRGPKKGARDSSASQKTRPVTNRGSSAHNIGSAMPPRAGPAATASGAGSDSAQVDVDDVVSEADSFYDPRPWPAGNKLQKPSTSNSALPSQDMKGKGKAEAPNRISTPITGDDPAIASYSPSDDGIVSPTPRPTSANTDLRRNGDRPLRGRGNASTGGLVLMPARR
ncbi:hypothetical protein B0T22DRAFT_475125 [Podospora appendiculata]|uniref:Uncharacterized protein n=1 Tax=Podospora appendiculata TaxID=314037 RepID=A0AAE0XEV0_9PEZI|nr:hypothetical protein B0T22DRAFT_475125 [Podospora appendiculata]